MATAACCSGPARRKPEEPFPLAFPVRKCYRAPNRDFDSQMADIFREIDEEVRRDKAAELWKKYGWVVTALAVLVVVGVAGW